MYSIEEFEKGKEKVLKYILYQKRSEQEIKNKFNATIEDEMLADIISYLKEAGYINDELFIEKTVNNFIALKNLSIKEVEYKLMSKGITKTDIDNYIYKNKEDLENYEIKSASNIIYKKSSSMEPEEIKQYLLKKGYKRDSIDAALEE